MNRVPKSIQEIVPRRLEAKPLISDSIPKPEFVGGNLCDPIQVLTPEELSSTDLALNSLANTRDRDSQTMATIIVD